MPVMDRHPAPRRSAPPVLELLEPPRGLGLTIDELEEAVIALDDVLEHRTDPDRRARLGRVRSRLESELGRIAALG